MKNNLIQIALVFLINCILSSVSYAEQVGNLEGEVGVRSGSLAYSLPIPMPPGAHKQSPVVSIEYGQHAGVGILGLGFSLSASSSITRCSPNIVEDGFYAGLELNALNRYCHDGKRLVPVVGANGEVNSEYRVRSGNENVAYHSVGGSAYHPESWVVNSPDGKILTFDKVDQLEPRFSSWRLVEQSDQFGNTIDYTYSTTAAASGEVALPMLEKITYAIHEINFDYEDSNNFVEQYQSGERAEINQRLAKIEIKTNGNLSYFYRFTYETLPLSSPVDRLQKIEKCFSDESCLRPLEFGYQDLPNANDTMDSPEDQTLVIPRDEYNNSSSSWGNSPAYVSSDLNKDGYPDFCIYKVNDVNAGIHCALFNGAGYDALESWSGDLRYEDTDDGYRQFNSLTLIDLNGDHFADFCVFDDVGVRCGINDKGNGFLGASYWSASITDDDAPSLQNLNGDQYIDLCGFVGRGPESDGYYQCFLGNGVSFQGSPVVSLDASLVDSWQTADTIREEETNHGQEFVDVDRVTLNYLQPMWADMDGDYDPDLCWMSISRQAFVCSYSSYNPSGDDVLLTVSDPVAQFGISLPGFGSGDLDDSRAGVQLFESDAKKKVEDATELSAYLRFANLNGDELPDFCRAIDQRLRCRINQGAGFGGESEWLELSGILNGLDDDMVSALLSLMQFKDVNHDGLSDACLVINQVFTCSFNMGEERKFGTFRDIHQIASDIGFDVQKTKLFMNFVRKLFNASTKFRVQVMRTGYGNLIDIPDINGDGYGELCYRSIQGIRCSSKKQYGPAGLLNSVTNSFGLQTTIQFGSLLGDELYDYAYASEIPVGYFESPPNAWVVKSVETDAPVVNGTFASDNYLTNKIDYRYGAYLVNPGAASQGFTSQTRTQQALNSRIQVDLHVEEHLQGREKLIKNYINDVLVNEKENVYNVIDRADGTYGVVLAEQVETQYDLNGSYVKSASVTYSDLDEYGYPAQISEEKTDNSETLQVTTTKTYHHDLERWVLGRPKREAVTHTSVEGTVVRAISYDYEDVHMVKQTIEPESEKRLITHYEDFDQYGYPETIRVTDKDGRERKEEKTYDQIGRVLTETNALNQTSTYRYEHDYCLGVTTAEDIAGNQVFNSYDVTCGKEFQSNSVDANTITRVVDWYTETQSKPTSQPVHLDYLNPIVYTVTETDSKGPWKKTYHDALGRTVMTEKSGLTLSTERINVQRSVLTYHVYDEHSREVATTLPFHKVDGVLVDASWAELTYDDANRVLTETKTGPDGLPITHTYTYEPAQNMTTVTASRGGYTKVTHVGIHGKPVEVNENGLSVLTRYNAIGDVKETEREGIITEIKYDDRGFKKKMIDRAAGTWEYYYNAFGELEEQTDGRGKVTETTYDDLGRKHTRTNEDGTTVWTYATTGGGVGQLEKEEAPDATRSWNFYDNGLVKDETLEVDGREFVTAFEYDDFSRVNVTIQPNGLRVITSYDNTGDISQVKIPANQINDVNWDQLADIYSNLISQMIQLEAQIMDYQRSIYEHEMIALQYEARMSFYQNLAIDLSATISDLRQLADDHRALAEDYRNQARELSDQAAALRAQFGDKRFSYVGIENDQYKFEYRKCTNRAAWYSFKRCKRWDIRLAYVPVGNINTRSDDPIAEFGLEEIHIYRGYDDAEKIIPSHLYEKAADAYRELATLHDKLANEADNAVSVSEDNIFYELFYEGERQYCTRSWDPKKGGYQSSCFTTPYSDTQRIQPVSAVDPAELIDGLKEKYTLADGKVAIIPFPCVDTYCGLSKEFGVNNQYETYYTITKIDNNVMHFKKTECIPTGWGGSGTVFLNAPWKVLYSIASPAETASSSAGPLSMALKMAAKLVRVMIPRTQIAATRDFSCSSSSQRITNYSTGIVRVKRLENGSYQYVTETNSSGNLLYNKWGGHPVLSPGDIPGTRGERNCQGKTCTIGGLHRLYDSESSYLSGSNTYQQVSNISITEKQHYTKVLDVVVDVTLQPYVPKMIPIAVGDITIFVEAILLDESQSLSREDLSSLAKAEFDAIYADTFGGSLIGRHNEFPAEIVLDGVKYKTQTNRYDDWNDQALSRQDELDHYLELDEYYTELYNQERARSTQLTTELSDVIDNYTTLSTHLAANEALYNDLGFEGESLESIANYAAELRASNANLTVWAVANRTPSGLVKNEVFGNGLYTERTYNNQTGQITGIKTGALGDQNNVMRDLNYTFTPRGSVFTKQDLSGDHPVYETFDYDDQGRLEGWAFNRDSQGLDHSYEFDDFGNLEYKTDAGHMIYDPHTKRLASREYLGQQFSYSYDENGNTLNDGDRAYTWGPNNKVSRIDRGSYTVRFDYDGENRRVVKRTNNETRYYVNPGYEHIVRNGGEVAQHTFFNGYEAVATLTKSSMPANDSAYDLENTGVNQEDVEADQLVYIHRDLLGSGELITDADMHVVARRYYSPYGREINELLEQPIGDQSNDQVVLSEQAASQYIDNLLNEIEAEGFVAQIPLDTNIPLSDIRGFTSHEMMDGVDLVHMNARLFDPVVGRFVSADSIIPDSDVPLAYNRYMYVLGNPATLNDPSGHDPYIVAAAAFFTWTQFSDDPNIQMLGQIALVWATSGLGIEGTGWQTAAVNSGMSATIVNFATTGDLGQSFKAGAFAALSAGVANSAAHGGINDKLGLGDQHGWKVIAFQVLSQGAIEVARGGKFKTGAVSTLITKVAGKYAADMEVESGKALMIAAGALAAGATGGDALQGALTASIIYLYNDKGQGAKNSRSECTGRPCVDRGEGQVIFLELGSDYGVTACLGTMCVGFSANSSFIFAMHTGSGEFDIFYNTEAGGLGSLNFAKSRLDGFSFEPFVAGTAEVGLGEKGLQLDHIEGASENKAVDIILGRFGVTYSKTTPSGTDKSFHSGGLAIGTPGVTILDTVGETRSLLK